MAFARGLSRQQLDFARAVERAGLATFSQAVKALQRGEARIHEWQRQLHERAAEKE